jgi:hypothetical protein
MTAQTNECIYCLRELPIETFTKEHVIPQAFGTFENNLTLVNCVCSDCNRFFGDNLEPVLAEGSFEAVRRLDYRIKSPESAKYLRKDRVRFSLRGGEWNDLVVGLQGDGDELFVSPVPQVRFAKKDGSGWIHFTESELAELSEPLPNEVDTKRIILIFDSEETKERLLQTLLGIGVEFQENESGFLSREKESWVEVETQIDQVILRCMAKIAFNYLTKTAGDDFARKRDFNPIRSYVRYGTAPDYDFFRISNYSILAYDTLTYRQTNGHLVTVNWSPDGRDIVSQVSLFNHRTYHFRLAMKFSGLWRNIRSGHHFNIECRKIAPLYRLGF